MRAKEDKDHDNNVDVDDESFRVFMLLFIDETW
jgi:hypothetical protein